jgi:hypothetical protein
MHQPIWLGKPPAVAPAGETATHLLERTIIGPCRFFPELIYKASVVCDCAAMEMKQP